MMGKLAAAAAVLLLLAAAAQSAGQTTVPLKATHTVQYTVRVYWKGSYYPDRTTIRLEISDIPIPTDYQSVSADLRDGRLENVNGRPVWVIERYVRDVLRGNVMTFTGTFVVTVDLSGEPPVPRIPVVPAGSGEYLGPDEYSTLSPEVVSLAKQIAAGVENDYPSVIAAFVEWIKKNIQYSTAVGEGSRFRDYQVLQLRAGVCDEFTTLFISFCRSVGIPARYVTGYSVENENLNRKLETGHAWAEVKVPGGWLPVDPTWVDLGGVKKFTTGGEGIHYRYSGAPPGSGVAKVEYDVVPVGWQSLLEASPVVLSGEKTENGWRISIANVSGVPVLDNLAVKEYVEEREAYEDLPGWPRLILLNPGENLSFDVGDFTYGWAFSRLGGSINLLTPSEPEIPLPSIPAEYLWATAAVVVVILLSAVITSVRKRR